MFQQTLLKQLFKEKLSEQRPKDIIVPAIIAGTFIPPMIVGTAVPTITIIVLTAYYWKSCVQQGHMDVQWRYMLFRGGIYCSGGYMLFRSVI